LHGGDDLGPVLAEQVAQAGDREADDGKGDEGGEHRIFLPVGADVLLMFLFRQVILFCLRSLCATRTEALEIQGFIV
jgi:hypothetical protein